MNMETGEIINSDHAGFEEMFNRGVLMPLDEAEKTTTKKLKRALMNEHPAKLSKNAAKRRRKTMRVK